MVHLHKKIIKGKSYYYLRETKWVDGKSKVVWQKYVGSAEKISELLDESEKMPQLRLKSFEYGKTTALLSVAEELNFVDIVNRHTDKKEVEGLTVGEYLLLVILGRCDGPLSKSETAKWFGDSFLSLIWQFKHQLNTENFRNHMKYVTEDIMCDIEADIGRILIERGLSPSKLIWDTTNFATDIEHEGKLAKMGKSKQGKNNKKLVSLGLAVSDDNVPFMHVCYPGNEHDSKLFSKIIDKLVERLSELDVETEKLVLVFDKGNNSEDNIMHAIEHMHVIGSLKRNQVKDLLRVPLSEYEFLYESKKGREVKGYKTKKCVFGQEFTILLKYDDGSHEKQMRRYESTKEEILAGLSDLKRKFERKHGRGRRMTSEGILKRAYELVPKDLTRVFEYLVDEDEFKYGIDENTERELYNSFGKTILFTDLHELSSEEIAHGYDSKYIVEHDFAAMKGRLLVPVKPYFQWTDDMIRVHTFLCVMGMLFYRYLFWKTKKFGMSENELLRELEGIRVAMVKRKDTKGMNIMFEEMTPLQARIFSSLNLGKYAP